MPRPLRIEYEGAWYHVMNRGANYQTIFYNDIHRKIFLELLEEVSTKFFVEIHCYCLMDNHYHLLVNTRLANLAKIMRHLNGVYTQKFNKIEKRDGPLFRGRYKSILIEEEVYLLQVSRYIHLNPVVANICSDPYQYAWSSFQFYAGRRKFCWLKLDSILNLIGTTNQILQYSQFISQGIDPETRNFYNKKNVRVILGTDKFIAENLKKNILYNSEEFEPDVNRLRKVPNINEIISGVTNYFNSKDKPFVNSINFNKNHIRKITIYLARQLGQLTHQKIAEIFSMKQRSVGKTLSRYKIMLDQNAQLQTLISKLSVIILNG